jgi:hypothetical protein
VFLKTNFDTPEGEELDNAQLEVSADTSVFEFLDFSFYQHSAAPIRTLHFAPRLFESDDWKGMTGVEIAP